MKSKSILYLLLSIFFMFSSCESNKDIYDSDNFNNDSEILELSHSEYLSLVDEIPVMKPENAIACIQSFIKTHFPSVKGDNISVSVKSKYYIDENNHKKSHIITKSEKEKNIVFYSLEVENTGEIGSAIVCADGRYPGVMAYVPLEINDSVRVDFQDNPMLELSERSVIFNIGQFNLKKDSIKTELLGRIGKICSKDINKLTPEDIENNVRIIGKHETKSPIYYIWDIEGTEVKRQNPMLYASWNQTAPYNRKLEQICEYDFEYEGRPPIGCTTVAIAATISHFEPPMMASGLTVNWPLIKQYRTVSTMSTSQRIRQVSTLMKWIGDNIGAEYDCEETSAPMDPAVAFMANYNIYTNSKSAMDVSKILNSIESNHNIVLIAAYREGGHGHAWVLDGFIRTNFNNTIRNYIWANLCWGGAADGLYLVESNSELTFEVSADRHYDRNFSIYPNIRMQ